MDFWQLVRYGISGCIGICTNIIVLYLLTDIVGVWYLLSAVLAFCVTLVVTFSLQKYWTFRDRQGAIMQQGGMYTAVALTSLSLNTALLYIAVDLLHVWYLGAQVIIMCMLSVGNFLANKYFTFRSLIQES